LAISFDYLISADTILFKKIWLFKTLLIFLPLFWIVFLIISSFLSYYNYRHTDKGYKLSLLKVFSYNILSSIVLAILLYFSWATNYIESKLEDLIPKYRFIFVQDKETRMIKVWQNENKGLLIWEIIEVWENKIFLKDYNNKEWNIILNNDISTNIRHKVNIKSWEKIKIIWEKIDGDNFKAFEIRPFMWKRK
jgi:hypothetical protein